MRKNVKLLGAVAVAGLVATTGSAFTASNTLNGDNVAGYNTDTVTGATTSAIEHTLNGTGTGITKTVLTFTTSQANNTVKAGFGSTALESCGLTTGDTTNTSYTCTYASAYDTSTAQTFVVSVS